MENTIQHIQETNNTQKTEPVDNLVKACLLSKRLHDFENDCSRFKQMKNDIREKRIQIEGLPTVEARLDIRLEEMENTKNKMTQELQTLNEGLTSQAAEMLSSAADPTDKFKQIELPSQKEIENLLFPDNHLDKIATKETDKIKLLYEEKVDISDYPKMYNDLKNQDRALREYLESKAEQTGRESHGAFQSVIQGANKSSAGFKLDVDKLVVDTTNKALEAYPSLKNQDLSLKLNLERRTKQALDEYLGSQLVEFILNPSSFTSENSNSTLYPTSKKPVLSSEEAAKIRKRRQQRLKIKAAVPKIAQMEKETNETIAVFEKNLNSYPVQRLASHLEHIDCVLKSHQSLLEFMNDPKGENKASAVTLVPISARRRIPSTVRLNEVDSSITNALATAVVGYTKHLYFSDLVDRVSKLEESI